ncbi:MAG TPA: hypothetical protein VGI54_01495, partial [Solirubrobacteraceae bacterium]
IEPAPGEQGTVFDAMVREADRIDALHLNYDYGGSHGLALAPTNGPFDCSSAVSRILQSTGVMGAPVRVSGDFASYGEPGIGVVTIVVIPGTGGNGHVYLVFHDPKTGHTRAWGTSSENPGGGPGWVDGYTYNYPGRSVVYRHVPLPSLDKKFDPSSLNLGSQFVPGAVPVSFDVHLVAYDGSGSSSGAGLVDLNASQIEIVKQIVKVGHQMGASHKEIVAAIEAGIVESSLRNLPPGAASDGSDSIGVFQMRPSQGWGAPAVLNDVSAAAAIWYRHAVPLDHGQTSGELAADVEKPREDLRYKYAVQESAAESWLKKVAG